MWQTGLNNQISRTSLFTGQDAHYEGQTAHFTETANGQPSQHALF